MPSCPSKTHNGLRPFASHRCNDPSLPEKASQSPLGLNLTAVVILLFIQSRQQKNNQSAPPNEQGVRNAGTPCQKACLCNCTEIILIPARLPARSPAGLQTNQYCVGLRWRWAARPAVGLRIFAAIAATRQPAAGGSGHSGSNAPGFCSMGIVTAAGCGFP